MTSGSGREGVTTIQEAGNRQKQLRQRQENVYQLLAILKDDGDQE